MVIKFRDRRAEEWLRHGSRALLNMLTGRSADQTQKTIATGLERGENPRSVGLELVGRIDPKSGKREGGSFELDKKGKQSIQEFRRCLLAFDPKYFDFDLRDKRSDPSVRKSFREMQPLSDERIELLVNRFEAKLLKYQADLIARTLMLAALNRSEWLSTKEAIEKSDLPVEAMARIWDSCGDDKVRPSHRALDGQRIVGVTGCFVSPLSGAKMMHPGDATLGAPTEELEGCRCRVRYDIQYGYGLD